MPLILCYQQWSLFLFFLDLSVRQELLVRSPLCPVIACPLSTFLNILSSHIVQCLKEARHLNDDIVWKTWLLVCLVECHWASVVGCTNAEDGKWYGTKCCISPTWGSIKLWNAVAIELAVVSKKWIQINAQDLLTDRATNTTSFWDCGRIEEVERWWCKKRRIMSWNCYCNRLSLSWNLIHKKIVHANIETLF